jgi:hypothetical protein
MEYNCFIAVKAMSLNVKYIFKNFFFEFYTQWIDVAR